MSEHKKGECLWGPVWYLSIGWTLAPLSQSEWDRLGPFATVLQCLHLDKPLLEQQNTKKLHATKNNCVHTQLGQILDQKIQKDQKTQLPLLKNREEKPGVGSKSRVLCMSPALNTTKGWAEHLSHPSGLAPGHTPTLTPYKEPARPLLRKWARETVTCFCSLLWSQGPQ